jgi:hypothetical protein
LLARQGWHFALPPHQSKPILPVRGDEKPSPEDGLGWGGSVTFQTVLASEPYTYVPTDGTAPVEANLAVVRRAE